MSMRNHIKSFLANQRLLIVLISVLYLFSLSQAEDNDISRYLISQRPGDNIRLLGMSGAGVAVPADLSSNIINPALFHAWHVENKRKIIGTMNYLNTPYYGSSIINAGVSYFADRKLSFGSLYSLYKKNDKEYTNRVTLSAGGEMFEGDTEQGPVFLGFNIRYSNMKWREYRDAGYRVDSSVVSNDTTLYDTVLSTSLSENSLSSETMQNSISFDLGLYQARITPFLEFGIVFHNLLGYTWYKEPFTKERYSFQDTSGTLADTLAIKDSSGIEYTDKSSEKTWRPRKREKWMTIGIALKKTLISGNLNTTIPFDLELLNIFDRDRRVNWGIRTGIELEYKSLSARFGFSRTPPCTIPEDMHNLENTNSFYGGTGIRFSNVSFDLSFSKNEWGINFSVFPGSNQDKPPPPPNSKPEKSGDAEPETGRDG